MLLKRYCVVFLAFENEIKSTISRPIVSSLDSIIETKTELRRVFFFVFSHKRCSRFVKESKVVKFIDFFSFSRSIKTKRRIYGTKIHKENERPTDNSSNAQRRIVNWLVFSHQCSLYLLTSFFFPFFSLQPYRAMNGRVTLRLIFARLLF